MSPQRTISKEVLEHLYIDQSMTLKDIARQLHASTHTIRRNMSEHGIACRTNGTIHTSHAMSRTRPYRIWQSMKTRCTNQTQPDFQKYGAHGISYPPSWETFDGFWLDMAPGYADDKTLDRIDGSLGYSKDNCRWVTYQGQNRNKSDNVLISYRGRTQCIAAWAAELGVSQTTLYHRKQRGWSDEKTISTPVAMQFSRL